MQTTVSKLHNIGYPFSLEFFYSTGSFARPLPEPCPYADEWHQRLCDNTRLRDALGLTQASRSSIWSRLLEGRIALSTG